MSIKKTDYKGPAIGEYDRLTCAPIPVIEEEQYLPVLVISR